MSELLSYSHILSDIKKFKKSGTRSGDDFNIYDTPTHKYFKLLFYFGSDSEFGSDHGSGLLAPTWEEFYVPELKENMVGVDENGIEQYEYENLAEWTERTLAVNDLHYYDFNSAWAYLKLNDENERAEKLQQFVTLLSDINCNSPWYFHSVGGLSEALERKGPDDGKVEMADKKLTITCLPDAFDNRIATLLELYRDVAWSWIHKKEVIPANLRKFDMAVYIFETPERNWHVVKDGLLPVDTVIDNMHELDFKPSYKMLEFHDCEISYNSIKSGLNELNNQTGFSPTYTIEITYADCYEVSYNDIMMRKIGDVILSDLPNNYESVEQTNSNNQQALIKNRTNPYDHGFLGNALSQVAGHALADVKSTFNRAILGNIYTYSLTNIKDQAGDLLNGNLIKSGMTIAQYIKEANSRKETPSKPEGNIFPESTRVVEEPAGKIYPKSAPVMPKSKSLGNIFNPGTIANN